MNLNNNLVLCNYFNVINLKDIMNQNQNKNKNKNKNKQFKSVLNERKYINKSLLIENLEYLSNIYFIEYEYYHDNAITKHYGNKIINNKLVEMIYNYNNFKKKHNFKLYGIKNYIEEKNIEESIMHFRNIIENNTTIFDFMNKK